MQLPKGSKNEGTREIASYYVQNKAAKLADLSVTISEKLHALLAPVPLEIPNDGQLLQEVEQLPKLWHDMRHSLQIIEDSLNAISKDIDKAEL